VITPVSIYLKLRDRFANTILLESSDYHSADNSYSYICCNPIASFTVVDDQITVGYPDGQIATEHLKSKTEAVERLIDFSRSFEIDGNGFSFIEHGMFGYMSYDAVEYFEDIKFQTRSEESHIPQIHYIVYRNVIVINHFKSELYLFDHKLSGEESSSNIQEISDIIKSKNFPVYKFKTQGEEVSNYTDQEFFEIVKKGIRHCHLGDVFQIVLSRKFQIEFKGDDFTVYRALRAINPSPYLFYFDFGSFKIFGSSPEAQIEIKNRKASIYPIAGTFRRSGNDDYDAQLAKKLSEDPKEDSEHVMLVDLARNDLSRNSSDVAVEKFKEIQFYSHVIHLVSKVSGLLPQSTSTIRVVADTFPAGTLSGAPKHMAMQLIDQYENSSRGYYGGAMLL
jgi:anthranilate synthase component 1